MFTDQRIRILRPCAKKCKIYSCRTSKISKDYLLNFVLSLVLNSKPIIFVLCLYEKYLFKNHLWKCISYKQARGSKMSLKRDMTWEFRPLKKEEKKPYLGPFQSSRWLRGHTNFELGNRISSRKRKSSQNSYCLFIWAQVDFCYPKRGWKSADLVPLKDKSHLHKIGYFSRFCFLWLYGTFTQ